MRLRLMILVGVMATTGVLAERVSLDRPMNVVVKVEDDTRLRGRLTAWDDTGFDLTDKDGAVHDVAWASLAVGQVYQIHEGLLPNDGRAWLRLGLRLREMDGGGPYAERAYTRALRLDEGLSGKVEQARKGEAVDVDAADAPAGGAKQDVWLPPAEDGPDGEIVGGGEGMAEGPRIIGGGAAANWGPQPQDKTDAAIARLKAFGEDTKAKINGNLKLFETDFFILYTDLSPEESRRWAGELDRMYARLCDLFGLPRDQNIWLGKCLILIFRSEPDYHRFQQVMHGTDSRHAAGMCHGYGSGEVHVAFYRQPEEMGFAHLLVHETVHGFLHRYRSPVHIPTWINEGLAETIGVELIPKCTWVPAKQNLGKTQLKLMGHTAGLFQNDRLEAWQYGVSASLTQFMIAQNKKGYVAFVNGIKDGQPWEQSLETNYGVGLDKLVRVFGTTQGAANLRP